jgi:hypothetical protein
METREEVIGTRALEKPMAIEEIPSQTSVSVAVPGRRLFRLGWVFLLVGLAIYAIQLFALKQYVVPWYAPILATIGVAGMLVAVVRHWTVWRLVGLAVCLLLTAGEWLFLTVVTPAPRYAGPGIGDPLPNFSAIDPSGAAVTRNNLLGRPTVLLFFRGHW